MPPTATPTAHPGVADVHFLKISSTDFSAFAGACLSGDAESETATKRLITSVRIMPACYNIGLMRRAVIALLLIVPAALAAQNNRIDTITPLAPELAAY